MSCTTDITDAEKAKRYDLLVRLKETYSWSYFTDKMALLFDDDFEPRLVEQITVMVERDIERWKE